MKLTAEWLLENLPHGSGINFAWKVTEKPTYFLAENGFEPITEAGFYDSAAQFEVVIPKAKPTEFKLHFEGALAQRMNQKYQLRDYLEEVLGQSLEEAEK